MIQLEEDYFIIGFHQQVAKDWQKAWHDHHIKKKQFVEGDLVLLYDSKFIEVETSQPPGMKTFLSLKSHIMTTD